MIGNGRAHLVRQLNGQYSLVIFVKAENDTRQRLQSTTPNLTLAAAFNAARDALSALSVGAEAHQEININTAIE